MWEKKDKEKEKVRARLQLHRKSTSTSPKEGLAKIVIVTELVVSPRSEGCSEQADLAGTGETMGSTASPEADEVDGTDSDDDADTSSVTQNGIEVNGGVPVDRVSPL